MTQEVSDALGTRAGGAEDAELARALEKYGSEMSGEGTYSLAIDGSGNVYAAGNSSVSDPNYGSWCF